MYILSSILSIFYLFYFVYHFSISKKVDLFKSNDRPQQEWR